MNMNQYTKIPNSLFEESQLSVNAKYLFCTLLKYCGKKDYCYPSQKTLGRILGCSERYIRNIAKELVTAEIVSISRSGFNKPNTYKVSKDLVRNLGSSVSNGADGKYGSPHLGTPVPLHMGTTVPPKSTYTKGKDKIHGNSSKGLEKCREKLKKMGFNIGSKSNQSYQTKPKGIGEF